MDLSTYLPQLFTALIVIFALMGALAWLAKRITYPRRQDPSRKTLAVVSSLTIGNREKLLLVSLNDQELLLGVTPSTITPLLVSPRPTTDAHDNVAYPPLEIAASAGPRKS